MASKSGQEAASTEQIEELLDAVDSTLDRLKTLYEQYFLGIQKQAPAFIHSDVERKLRDLTQINIRNTGLRYRLATLQQKFGSYNSYWRRTLRQIENGTYVRNLAKIGREAARTGSNIPDEILAAMPKRMREQVLRDRDQAVAIAKRRQGEEHPVPEPEPLTLADEEATPAPAPRPAPSTAPPKTRGGAHVVDEADADIDFNEMFSAFDDDAPKEIGGTRAHRTTVRPQSRPQMPRMPLPSEAQQTTVLPKSSVNVPAQTTALPRMTPAAGVPRPVGQQPSAPIDVRVTPSAGVPRPVGSQPSAPIDVRVTPSAGVPRPIGQQPSAPTATAIPRPTPAGMPASGPTQVPRPTPAGMPASGPPQVARSTPAGMPASGPTQVARSTPTAGTARPTPPAGVAVTQPMRPTPPAGVPVTRPTPPAGVPVPQPIPPAGRQTPPAGLPPITQPIPRPPMSAIPRPAPSQQSRPVPIVPGSAAQTGPVPVESMAGPFPRTPPAEKPPQPQRATQSIARPTPTSQPAPPKPALKPPPGMTEADVNALHAKYVKAKEMVGEKVDAGSREKLLKTINQTAPKIMEQYQAKAVDFSVVVKDNQVIIKAKPKT